MRQLQQLVALILFFLTPALCNAQDWPALRGSDGLGVASPKGILSKTSDVELKVRWKTKIGSGYSSVIVADGMVVVMYTEGDQDVVAGVDAESGDIKWKYSLGPMFVGKNGSFDGPLTTPTTHQGKIYGISATGRLFCLDLKSGNELWKREFTKEDQARQPMYGFTTSPIVAGGCLVVQVGAKDKALMGFDLDAGTVKWSCENDMINSQTPFKATIGEKEVVLAMGGRFLMGVDPSDGKVLFKEAHKGGNGSAVTPVPIGNDKYLLTNDDAFSIAYSLTPSADKIHVAEAWKQRSIKNTYNIPVFTNGNIFAYSTRILTCVDPETGRPKWKSRAPGDGFTIAVDNHLVVSTKKGSLHLAKASDKKYEEIAELKLFDDLVWSIPAYSDNSIFQRSLGEVARVDIVSRDQALVQTQQSKLPLSKKVTGLFLDATVNPNVERRNRVLQEFIDKHQMPFVDDGVVHFFYKGKGTDVAVASDIFGARQERKMRRLEDTDFFWYSVKLPDDQRANYIYLVDYEPITDPKNDRTITSSVYAGEMEFAVRLRSAPPLKMSWFAMPDWKEPSYLNLPEKMAGQMTAQTVKTGEESSQEINVYLPPSYEKSEKKYPVAFVSGGKSAIEQGRFAKIADSIFQAQKSAGKQLAPECLIVFLPSNPRAPMNPALLSSHIIPFVDKEFRTIAKRTHRMTIGFGFEGGGAILGMAANHKEISLASIHSPLMMGPVQDMVKNGLNQIEMPSSIHVEWGRYDMFNPHENWDLREMTQSFVDEYKDHKHVTVKGSVVNDTTDWSSWQNRYHKILNLLPDSE